MTSNERKIIKCLWEAKGKAHIRMVAQKANLSSDYVRLLCRSLARSGHIKFENDLAYLLKKGRSRFENNDPVADEPMAVAANVTLLTDEPTSSDEELDKALADLEPSSKKDEDEDEEKCKPEESKDETELKPEPKAEEKSVKPSGDFGASFKKIVNWFTEKK